MKRFIQVSAGAALGITLMGASCFEVTDPLELTFNINNITATYNVTAGAQDFGAPQSCSTINSATYLDTDFEITAARLSNITIQTVGNFAANIVDGLVTVNGTEVLSYSGPWNSFNEPQSLLTSDLLERNPAGIAAFISAVENKQPITVCSSGSLSEPATGGLQVVATTHAQVDATP